MQQKQTSTGLVWFQNNLRIHDNISLAKACENHEKVIGVFIFDKHIFDKPIFGFTKVDKFRTEFLIDSVKNLKQNLAKKNSTLLTYFDFSDAIIPKLCKDLKIEQVYLQKEWTSEEVTILQKVKRKLPNVNFIEDYDQFLYHPETVSNNFEKIPNVFTPFRKKLEKYVTIKEEVSIPSLSTENLIENNTEIPTLKDFGFDEFQIPTKTAFPFKGGENEALTRVNFYLFESKKVGFYKKTRNGLVGQDYSTKFSAWLANGSLSAKTIYWKIKAYEQEFGKNQSTYWVIFELIWRDFFKYISLKHGNHIFKLGGIQKKITNGNLMKK